MGQVSLRWVYVHMIEEICSATLGHADILREQTDGAAIDDYISVRSRIRFHLYRG